MGSGRPREVTGLRPRVQAGSSDAGEPGAWRRGQGCGQPHTKVAWCGLALGLVGAAGTGLGPRRSDAGGLLAGDLRGPVHTPRTPRPSTAAESATRSTSMIVLAGTPRLPGAPRPVTRRQAVTCLPGAPQVPRQETPPHPPRTDTGCGRGSSDTCGRPGAGPLRPGPSVWGRRLEL